MKENTAKKATCCHKCGRVHVKGTACKRPYLTGKDSCAVNEVQDLKEFFSKPLKEAELKLGVKYKLPNGDTGYIMTQSSDDPKDWIFSDGFKKVPYLSVKKELKPLATQPGKYDGAFDLGLGKGHHIDERMDDVDNFAGSDPKAGSMIQGRGFDWDKNTVRSTFLKKERAQLMRDREQEAGHHIDEGPHQGKTEEELRSYIKGLMKDRASAASKGQDGLVSGINKEIKQLAKELKKRETTITEGEKTIKGPFTYETVQDLVSRYGRGNGLFFRRKSNGELYGVGSIFLASDEPDFAVVDADGYEDYMDYSDIDYVVIEDIKESTIAEAKKMTLGNYLDDLDSRFVDFMRAADGKNAKGSQGIDMLATINHNFNLFRNYISSIKKEYSSELNKELTFSIDEAKEEDKIDIVTMDVPLFIRALEYAKEDAQEDMDLHDFAEKAIAGTLEKGTLTMEDYDMLTGNVEPVDEYKTDYQRRREKEGDYQQPKKDRPAPKAKAPKNDYFAKRKAEMGDEAKIDALQRFKRGEIDTLPEDPREDMINRMMREVKNKKSGLWANINAKQARGEKPSHGNSKAFKDAVKAGEKLHKTKK